MDKFKKTLRKRLYGIAGYNLVLIALLCFALFYPTAGNDERMQSFMAGFTIGLFLVAQGTLILSAIKYNAALKNEQKRKALYIEEHDERLLSIQSKIGGAAMQIILFGLLAATITAGYFDQKVFFTLLGALIFSTAVKAVLKIHYTKRAS